MQPIGPGTLLVSIAVAFPIIIRILLGIQNELERRNYLTKMQPERRAPHPAADSERQEVFVARP
jgi:hypothetical protein